MTKGMMGSTEVIQAPVLAVRTPAGAANGLIRATGAVSRWRANLY
jgi:hypothetical protein